MATSTACAATTTSVLTASSTATGAVLVAIPVSWSVHYVFWMITPGKSRFCNEKRSDVMKNSDKASAHVNTASSPFSEILAVLQYDQVQVHDFSAFGSI